MWDFLCDVLFVVYSCSGCVGFVAAVWFWCGVVVPYPTSSTATPYTLVLCSPSHPPSHPPSHVSHPLHTPSSFLPSHPSQLRRRKSASEAFMDDASLEEQLQQEWAEEDTARSEGDGEGEGDDEGAI